MSNIILFFILKMIYNNRIKPVFIYEISCYNTHPFYSLFLFLGGRVEKKRKDKTLSYKRWHRKNSILGNLNTGLLRSGVTFWSWIILTLKLKKTLVLYLNCTAKRDFIIEKQIAQHFVQYSECLLKPLPLYSILFLIQGSQLIMIKGEGY